MMMKAGVFYGSNDIRPEEIEVPETGPDDILVKVISCGICGSDLHAYRQGIFSRPGWVMGHEMSGEVVLVGEKVKDIQVGDRVVPLGRGRGGAQPCGQCFWCQRGEPRYCEALRATRKPCGECKYCLSGKWWLCDKLGYGKYGGFAEYFPIQNAALNTNVYKLSDNMSYDEGATVEPLRGCFPWISLADPQPYDTAVVLGLGTIGLLTMQVLKRMVSRVIVSEISQKRLQVARDLGADVVIDASREDPVEKVIEITGIGRSGTGKGGGRADFVMECSGSGRALQQAMEMIRAGGRIVLVGLFEGPVTLDVNRIIFKDLKLISSQTCMEEHSSPQLILRTIEEIASGKVKVDPLISHEFPLEKIKDAFELQSKAAESVKVMVKP